MKHPRLSYCIKRESPRINPKPEPEETRIVAKFDVLSSSLRTLIWDSSTQYANVEIDGVLQNGFTYYYTFETPGIHTCKYTLQDETNLVAEAFYNCGRLINIKIPNGIQTIGSYCFERCNLLTNVTIPSSVTSISQYAFDATSLANVTVLATIPPIAGENIFSRHAQEFKIYVPASSVDAYKAASGWSTYADSIQAIPQN